MPTDTNLPNDVLHSEHHSQLSAEEIAKAVARHNHKHPANAPTGNASVKNKKSRKG
jgi:hypothetical protein